MAGKASLPGKWHKALVAAGYVLTITGNSHLKYMPPPGRVDRHGNRCPMIIVSNSPGDQKQQLNLRAQLRRHGVL